MNKSEQREVNRIIAHLNAGLISADMAAGELATLHRSARNQRSQAALLQTMQEQQLLRHLRVVNGCWVPA